VPCWLAKAQCLAFEQHGAECIGQQLEFNGTVQKYFKAIKENTD
jgi:hypothetical protein